jgi:leader peptidase (prepilin peptidase)/N-methyltransferase
MSPWELAHPVFLFAAAAAIGSFLGTLVICLPAGESIVIGRSKCSHCRTDLPARDLVPLLSWIWICARCRACHRRISAFYPLIELASVAVAFWAAAETSSWVLLASSFLGWTLLALGVIDWRENLLPDELTLMLIPTGLGAAYLSDATSAIDHVIGALAGFAALTMVAWAYRRLRGREGLGGGDVKLLAGLGAWVGWIGLPTIILLSTGLALSALVLKALLGERLSATDRLPFGTYLVAAGWLVWLYGPLVPE